MRVAVIGAGIIGVTTAFELAADGHEVTVFERRASVAEETSFANAGVVAPGYVTPWAAPGMPGKVARFLLSEHAPVRVTLPLSRDDIAWMWKWYQSCDLASYVANRTRMQRLAFYSRTRLHDITDHFGLEYERTSGYMVLLRGEKDRKLVEPGLQVLRDAGVAFKEIGAEDARKIEPAINPEAEFSGAIHLPNDEAGNCRQFAMAAAKRSPGLRREVRVQHGGGTAGSGRAGLLARLDAGRRCTGAAALRGGDCLRRRRLGGAAAPAGPAHPARGGLWLFDQRAHPRPVQRAAQCGDGRTLQGGDHPHGQPRARRGQRRDRRATPEKAAGRHRRRSTKCCTTGSRVRRNLPTPARACRNGKARGPCCPMVRR